MLTITTEDNTLVLQGRLDTSTVDDLRKALDKLSGDITVDLGKLEYINSAGLGLLLGAYQRVSQEGGSVRILNPTPYIRELFSITGLDHLLLVNQD